MGRLIVLATLVTLTACNGLLGLDPTNQAEDPLRDTDGDGVADYKDDCPLIFNADQLDGDHDGKGDACDMCAGSDRDGDGIQDGCDLCPDIASSNHDEDGDLVGDECDNCPTVAGSQTDSDSDKVGDVCDLGPKQHQRALFDAFAPFVGEPLWHELGATDWTASADHDAVVSAKTAPDATWSGLQSFINIGNADEWYVSAGIVVPAGLAATDELGIALLYTSTKQVAHRCAIECDSDVCWVAANRLTRSKLFAPGAHRLTMRVTTEGVLGTVTLTCMLDDDPDLTTEAMGSTKVIGKVTLISTVLTEIRYVFAIE